MPKHLILQNITYAIVNTPVAFTSLSLAFSQQSYGLIGQNGIGKSTLLQLLSGSLVAHHGQVQCNGTIHAVLQGHDHIPRFATISDAMGVTSILNALHNIQSGEVNETDYECVGQHWDIEARIDQVLQSLNLIAVKLSMPFHSLSGGQKTKVLLAKAMLSLADFLLMDEPTNNLDRASKKMIYNFIEESDKGLIIASHDRELLNKMNHIIEMTSNGLTVYGGNYDFYKEQKDIQRNAVEKKHEQAIKCVKKRKLDAQKRKEKHQKLSSKGRKASLEGSVDKLSAFSKKSRSEKTHERNIKIDNSRGIVANHELDAMRQQKEWLDRLHFHLEAARVPASKVLVDIKSAWFSYPKMSTPIIQNFNCRLQGSKRIAIKGGNGSGKSTLLKIIQGILLVDEGTMLVATDRMVVLDQTLSFLENNQSLLNNYCRINASMSERDARFALATMGFRGRLAEKKVGKLSGGQRMRAGLVIALLNNTPPQLIILDEPTNHIDLQTTQEMEKALRAFQGAMIIVSHDEDFLNQVGIDEVIVINQQ